MLWVFWKMLRFRATMTTNNPLNWDNLLAGAPNQVTDTGANGDQLDQLAQRLSSELAALMSAPSSQAGHSGLQDIAQPEKFSRGWQTIPAGLVDTEGISGPRETEIRNAQPGYRPHLYFLPEEPQPSSALSALPQGFDVSAVRRD